MTSPTVEALLAKGVRLPHPASVDIAPEVDPDRISANGVTIHAGCRLRGASTVLSAGVELGREGPVTVEDCQLGEGVKLHGGYAAKSVFLDRASLSLGHHVREGCILEEEASGAHTVGLKQTILFPFVTLGSLINFCDAFMAGGTSRADHSEVGSSYIHFNFTPAGDKTTPSMFGDVPRGVLLRERPIFLGGQGGAVGPVRVGYGNIVGAGSILRGDIDQEDRLRLIAPPGDLDRPFRPEAYRRLWETVAKNLHYLASLDALTAWYRHARAPFFAVQELGSKVLEGALGALVSARQERISRLRKLAKKLVDPSHLVFAERIDQVAALFGTKDEAADAVVEGLAAAAASGVDYLSAVQALDDGQAVAVRRWLAGIVEARLAAAQELLPELSPLVEPRA